MNSSEKHLLGQHQDHRDDNVRQAEHGATVELREEELLARKESVQAGAVRIGTDILGEQRTIEVPVTREEVIIERRPVAPRPADGAIGDEDAPLNVSIHQEQVVAEKRPVVYEELEVGTRTVQATQRVRATVQREVVDIDAQGDVELGNRP